MRLAFFLLFFVLLAPFLAGQETSSDPKPAEMMQRYLFSCIDEAAQRWTERYEQLKTPEEIRAYQKERQDFFRQAIGWEAPFTEKTPLRPQIVKQISKRVGDGGYRVEMVLFESLPQFYVTAALFLPDDPKYQAPYPAMLVACGHSAEGKALPVYQQACALAALNGVAALIVDPIDQGERSQNLREDGKPYTHSTASHNIDNLGSIPLGRNTAIFMIHDLSRAVDYLESREDIDARRIGVAGNSGGGTQSSYMMALDPRLKVAAPNCYICSLYGKLPHTIGPQDAEQNIFGQLAFGMDHVDYLLMRAPQPTLIGAATRDFFPIDDTWAAYRHANRIYDRFGDADKVAIIETDQQHGWSKTLREGTARWMVRWFYGIDRPIVEPDPLPVLSPEEIRCTPQGQVILLDGARTVFDLNRDLEKKLAEERRRIWQQGLTPELTERIRRCIGVEPPEQRKNDSALHVEVAKAEQDIQGVSVFCQQAHIVRENDRIRLPMFFLSPQTDRKNPPLLFLHENGDQVALTHPKVGEALKNGRAVVAVDLRGLGETQATQGKYFDPKHHGRDGHDFYLAYLLGKIYVGMRTEDLLVVADLLREHFATEKIDLYAYGLPGTVALHAAALNPEMFSAVEIEASLTSWADVITGGNGHHPLTGLVHGALRFYDLPDLAGALQEKVRIVHPRQPTDPAWLPSSP